MNILKYIIFTLVLAGIVYLLYPSTDKQALDEAKNRLNSQSELSQNISEEQVISEEKTPAEEVKTSETLQTSEEEKIQENVVFSDEALLVTDENTSELYQKLPTSALYGDPLRISETSFTYSGVKGLEIRENIFPTEMTCEGITDYLSETLNSWYYWNTCRDIIKDKWIKFNVLRLEWENYIYERHYFDFVHGLYGVMELERGLGITSDMLPEQNKAFSEKEFPVLEVVDELIRDIVKIS